MHSDAWADRAIAYIVLLFSRYFFSIMHMSTGMNNDHGWPNYLLGFIIFFFYLDSSSHCEFRNRFAMVGCYAFPVMDLYVCV